MEANKHFMALLMLFSHDALRILIDGEFWSLKDMSV